MENHSTVKNNLRSFTLFTEENSLDTLTSETDYLLNMHN